MLIIRQDQGLFFVRVAGVLISHNRVLLQKAKLPGSWVLPGGRAEMHEDTASAVIREFQEELGLVVRTERLLWVMETFNAYQSQGVHEIGFYYLLDSQGADRISQQNGSFGGVVEMDGDHPLEFRWFPLDALDEIQLFPSCLKSGLRQLPAQTTHWIHYES